MRNAKNTAIRSFLLLMILLTYKTTYSQLMFQVDSEHPCPGDWFTVSLPLNCTYQRLIRTQLVITPTPDEAMDVADHTIMHEGVVGIRLKYKSYRPTIDIHGPYTCNGVVAGNVVKTVQMSSPVTITPNISGLENKVYSGDRTIVSAAFDNNPATTYAWQLNAISQVSGSISLTAIASPTSRETAINWPKDFVGTVNIQVTSTRCSSSRQSIKQVVVLAPPAPLISLSSAEPSTYCPGTTTRYRVDTSGSGFEFIRTSLVPSPGVDFTVYASKNGVPIEWSVTWNKSGQIKVAYNVTDGTRTWSDITPPISVIVAQFSGGKINAIPIDTYCSPYSLNLSLAAMPSSNDYAWQYCNTGNCAPASGDWKNNINASSPLFTNLTQYTCFRIKLNDERCGLVTSNVTSIIIERTPKIVVSDKTIFSGNTVEIPVSDVPQAVITVSATATGVKGVSGYATTDTLTTTGNSDGTVNYQVRATNGFCSSTSSVTVTVYKKPVIYANRHFVYKGLDAMLSTDLYDSYEWRTSSDRFLTSKSTYQTYSPGSFKVLVTRNGLKGESDVISIGDQFDGVNKNYIITRTPLRKFTSDTDLKYMPESDVMESVQYFDGTSRPLQTINTRLSPSHFDLVQPVYYDRYGLETIKYLPYISSQDNGRYQKDALNDQQMFYQSGDETIANDPAPFSPVVFENSPLNRILRQGSPGLNPDHAIKFEYSLNTAADSVMRFNYNISSSSLERSQYSPGVLFRNKVIDEEKNDVIEFVDKLSRTVCKKVKAGDNLYATTYYVYDDIGNLVVVIPPEGVRSLKTEVNY